MTRVTTIMITLTTMMMMTTTNVLFIVLFMSVECKACTSFLNRPYPLTSSVLRSMMTSNCPSWPLQDLSHQQYPGLRSGPTFQRPPPQLNGLTALDQRSRRRRPGRLSTPVPSVPCALDGVRVRRMGMRDLQTVKTLMRSEGWNVDFGNMAAVFRIQPAAFFVVETATGDVIGKSS